MGKWTFLYLELLIRIPVGWHSNLRAICLGSPHMIMKYNLIGSDIILGCHQMGHLDWPWGSSRPPTRGLQPEAAPGPIQTIERLEQESTYVFQVFSWWSTPGFLPQSWEWLEDLSRSTSRHGWPLLVSGCSRAGTFRCSGVLLPRVLHFGPF